MPSERTPKMSTQDYVGFLGRAVLASRSADVERLRAEALERWCGDPWAPDLDWALALYQERLTSCENPLRVQSGHTENTGGSRPEQPTR